MTRLLTALLTVFLFAAPVYADHVANELYSASAILYAQEADGGMKMRCTVTAFEKTDTGYHFVSASHCVSQFNAAQNRVEIPAVPLYISYDRADSKVFHTAEVVMAGAQGKGDDFAILHVETEDNDWKILRMGDFSRIKQGELVVNVAAPKGLGLQVFFGYVSMINLDRPILSNGINWLGATLLQIPAGPGSSGSAVASEKQGAIVCFIVGGINGNPSAVAIPASRFLEFRRAVEKGEYEWFKLKESTDEGGTDNR
jgi:hypothetical protein